MNEQVIPANAQIVQAQPSVDYNIFIQELTEQKRGFENFLMGVEEIKDKDGNKQIIQSSEPRTNVEGRKAIMSWVNNYITPNVYLAENKEHNVVNIYKLDQVNILTMLYMHLNDYELTIEEANNIHSQLCQVMHHALQRSMTDKKYIFPTIKTNYDQNGQPQQQREKLWGLF
jgi:hypothetical protein